MLRYEIKSDRDVLVDGIGLLSANESVELSDEQVRDFELRNATKLVEANFPYFVEVTTVIAPEEGS